MNQPYSPFRLPLLLFFVFFASLLTVSCGQNTGSLQSHKGNIPEFHQLKGPYLGQTPPGMVRQLFAPGLISDGLFNGMVYFTADGTEVFFSSGFEKPFYISLLFHSHMKDGRWGEPVEFPVQRDVFHRPVLGPDGKKVLFISSRAEAQVGDEPNPVRIYCMDKQGDRWSKPRKIDFGDAFPYSCSQATIAANGNLYFQAGYHIDGDEDIYFAKYEDGSYMAPVKLSDKINGPGHEVHPFIAPDERYLIFDAARPEGFGQHDLYVSFRDENGQWTEARNLGQIVNTANDERRASVSSDGKYLFFESQVSDAASRLPESPMTLTELRDFWGSAQNGDADVYWIDVQVIEELRTRALK